MAANQRWSDVIRAAAKLQRLLPDAVLVGGSAASIHAGHRISFDDDHVITDLKSRFDEVLAALEETDGWVTSRIRRPVLVLGKLDGVETGIRNLIRRKPLEVETVVRGRRKIKVPTLAEMTRIKAWMCLMRNATRDYLDLVALADQLGDEEAVSVLLSLDDYYEDQLGRGGRRVATQVAKQLAEPVPDDLSEVDLTAYRQLDRRWQSWTTVADACRRLAVATLHRISAGQ